ncbi:MAG: (E)-4-hydroxy-3-methylbut-2-enyl-diphosphate synthase [Prevotella sp.]|nr:(E)-4-hydroxy-3-methylbut-2-enyl-diphosphate synthase [Prevotella sp.]
MKRRFTTPTHVGNITIGGGAPIRVQSMNTTNTNDTEACVAQAKRIISAGGELVRLTTQGSREAENMKNISAALKAEGIMTPLVADVHFNANVADIAAKYCEKVRVNPGNYVDPARTFKKLEYTDEEYQAELKRIEERFVPFLNICKEHHTAVRIGVNHGSLSDRIMSRYGDTPEGIVESCMEFLRICKRENFNDVVLSIKASNTVVMVTSVRLLVKAMDQEDMHYPLHLGVTEAGEGEDGRIKSAVGIGALLSEGIGDTIRVSLSEEPENEIPVAKKLIDPPLPSLQGRGKVTDVKSENLSSPLSPSDIPSTPLSPSVPPHTVCRWIVDDVLYVALNEDDADDVKLYAAMWAGAPLIEGKAHELVIYNKGEIFDSSVKSEVIMTRPTDSQSVTSPSPWGGAGEGVSESILQAARVRFTKTEYISCPGCGRTLYDLQGTIARIKAAVSKAAETNPRFKTLKIGIMGCIVNGPGEMADADYGYVGAGPNKISLYKGKECVEKNIPEAEAVQKLLDFIEKDI